MTHDWSRYDPTLAALPKPAPPGTLDALAAAWGVPRPTLEWRLRRLRRAVGTGAHRRWSATDEARLTAAIRALASELGRTPGAVIARAVALAIAE